jgi:biopolymer transport protein ExbD
MAGGAGGDGEFGFQIAPMLDILFVLLLFFMVSAGAQKHEASLTTQLPGIGNPGGDVPVQVGIDADGQVNVSGAPIDSPTDSALPQLVDRLKGVVAANAAQPIIVTPTRSTRHQRVVDVLNACAAAKVKNLAFGTPAD